MAHRTLLRSRTDGRHARVGFVELFFDLVFVFAVTQISHLLLAQPDLEHALQSAFLLAALWGVWIWTAWATNWLDAERAPTRFMMFLLMGGGLVLAAAIPDAFGARGLVFALAYVAMQNGRTAFFVYALRDGKPNELRNFQRAQVWLAAPASSGSPEALSTAARAGGSGSQPSASRCSPRSSASPFPAWDAPPPTTGASIPSTWPNAAACS
jgi:low temperature requirement protein LtrA